MKLLERLLIAIGAAGAAWTVAVALFILSQAAGHALASRSDDPVASGEENAVRVASNVDTTAATAAEQDQGRATGKAEAAAQPAPAPSAQQQAPKPEQVAGNDAAIAAGAKVFRKCKACHAAEAGGKNKTGPNLWNVVGRPIGSVEGFNYSDAMKSHGGTWDTASLDAWLANPKAFIAGNKMAFGGIKKQADRANLIAFLASRSDTAAAAAPAAGNQAAANDQADTTAAGDGAAAAPHGIDPELLAYLESTYRNAPERSAEQVAQARARAADLQKEVDAGIDYQRARYHPIHFQPAISEASNEECLVCHQEILTDKPRDASPAGVPAEATLAWYQTLDTYQGPQATFHWRHLESDFAKQVMNLQCNFCHKGNDPREESPDMLPTRAAGTAPAVPEFTNRKMVNPSETCLLCHGAMPDPENIMGLPGPWPVARLDIEDEETVNGCLTCHETIRTNRHNVSYLNALNIEKLAREKSDTCFGCHGGRQWYQISYPYPRHPWPDMDTEVPDWAQGRPTSSKPEYQLPENAQ